MHAPKLLEQEYLQTGEYQDTTTATTDEFLILWMRFNLLGTVLYVVLSLQ